jgi:uncharacterized protein YndB with AHSA1/START domain
MTTKSKKEEQRAAPRALERSQLREPFQALRFEGTSRAPAEAVYDLLADLRSHLDWAGERQSETTRLVTMEAPAGTATVGTEFVTTGTDGKVARFADRSVVTEAIRPRAFEFVTESRREGKSGSLPWRLTLVHHYEIAPQPRGCRVVYTEDITRMTGAPTALVLLGFRRLVFRVAAKYMRRGFDALLAMAEERSGLG